MISLFDLENDTIIQVFDGMVMAFLYFFQRFEASIY